MRTADTMDEAAERSQAVSTRSNFWTVQIREFFAHYHGERNHQGLENRLIAPIERIAAKTGSIRRRQRLGGMLNYKRSS